MSEGAYLVLRIVAVAGGAFLLFLPLGAVLIAAARSGRGRILAAAFFGSLVVVGVWLAVAVVLRQTLSVAAAGWWLLGAPWASALGAVVGWRRARAKE